jgi:hypothetical protein
VNKTNFWLLSTLLFGMILTGCKNGKDEPKDNEIEQKCSITIIEAEAADNAIEVKSNGSTVSLRLNLKLSEALDRDIEVQLASDDGAAGTYNAAHNTSHPLLPVSRYSFKDESGVTGSWIIIPAGDTRSTVTLNIAWSNATPGVSTFLLPVHISSASTTSPAIKKRLEISAKPYYVVVTFDIPEPPPHEEPPKVDHIPVLRISTGNPYYDEATIKKDPYIPATLTIEDPDGLYSSVAEETVTMEIKGRGNTTWDLPKKPYRLKLTEKKRLLGMPNNKHFVLLANYNDKSLLRNSVAFRLSELAGMMWAPRWVPVELYIDNDFRGQYMLTEQVRVDKERINIDVVGADETDGGYSFEIDWKEQDEGTLGWLQLPRTDEPGDDRLYFAFDDPEEPTAEQKAWAKDYIDRVQTAINKATTLSTGYVAQLSDLIDVSSFIQYFFVQEITKNIDGNLRLSSPIAIARGGTLFFPCVWDFDLALGVANYHANEQRGANSSHQGWYVRNAQWLKEMFKSDEFCDRVQTEWMELYPKLASINDDVESWENLISDAQMRDAAKWGSSNSYSWEVRNMLTFYNDRVEWMNSEIRAGRHKYPGN